MTTTDRITAARRALDTADRALDRFAMACSRPGRDRSPEQAARDAAHGEKLLAACTAADAELRAALATA